MESTRKKREKGRFRYWGFYFTLSMQTGSFVTLYYTLFTHRSKPHPRLLSKSRNTPKISQDSNPSTSPSRHIPSYHMHACTTPHIRISETSFWLTHSLTHFNKPPMISKMPNVTFSSHHPWITGPEEQKMRSSRLQSTPIPGSGLCWFAGVVIHILGEPGSPVARTGCDWPLHFDCMSVWWKGGCDW